MGKPIKPIDMDVTQGSRTLTFVGLIALALMLIVILALALIQMDQSRQSSLLASCKNNLRQLGIATLNFESAHMKLPKGYNGPLSYDDTERAILASPTGYPLGGPLVATLPFMLTGGVTDCFEGYRVADVYWTNTDINMIAANKPYDTFTCPADDAGARLLTGGTPNFSTFFLLSGRGQGWWMNDAGGDPISSHHNITNYLGCAGDYLPAANEPASRSRYQGVFVFGNQVGLGQVSDGASNTIMYGEVTGKGTDTCFAWTASSQVVHWNAGNFAGVPYPDYDGAWWCFGSEHHSDVINWVYCDSSTHTLSENMNPQTLRELAGRADAVATDE